MRGWALSTPIGAANDEGAQVLRAVSVVRGQLLGQPLTASSQETLDEQQLAPYEGCARWGVGVLGADKQAAAQRCAAPFTSSLCPGASPPSPGPNSATRSTLIPTTAPFILTVRTSPSSDHVRGAVPPLYYAIVGCRPSHTDDMAIYAMRMLSGSERLADRAGHRHGGHLVEHRMLLLAVTVAATPLLIVFGSVVNPSGLEMSAALCTWTGALTLVLDHAERPPRGLVVACTATAALFALACPLSVFWLALIALFVVLLRPRAVRSSGPTGEYA